MSMATDMLKKELVIAKLPVRQAVLVPSTKEKSEKISEKEYRKRIKAVKRYLSDTFGGYTALKGHGGYYSENDKMLIEEPVVKVESFTTRPKFRQNEGKLLKQINRWGRNWGQESMGYEYEDDLNLIKGI